MKDFSSLLNRVVKALHSDSLLKDSIRDAVKECTGGSITDADITIKEGTLSISASPALRSELRLKEERILKSIAEKTGKRLVRIQYR